MNKLAQLKLVVPIIIILAIVVYALLWSSNQNNVADIVLGSVVIVGTIPLVFDIVGSFLKRKFGVDYIAITGILASLLLGEYLAGAIILLMLSGGELLEEYAYKRSGNELKKLLSLEPQVAHRYSKDKLQDINVKEVQVNDLLLIKPGEVVPVDGVLTSSEASLTEANITGESLPVTKVAGDQIYSGTVVMDNSVQMTVTSSSENSKYQQIIALVKEAEKNKAPFVRMADKYSIFFTISAFLIAGLAWMISGDPLRALLVLVVATPCPLILAAPIAFASGISIGAGRGIIFKSGQSIESLGKAKAIIFDKTGTLTFGKLAVESVISLGKYSEQELIQLTYSAELHSIHIIAKAIKEHAEKANIAALNATNVSEDFGLGLRAIINETQLFFGKPALVKEYDSIHSQARAIYEQNKSEGLMLMLIMSQSEVLGYIKFSDQARPDVAATLKKLSKLGITKQVMLTGDNETTAARIAKAYDIKEYQSKCLPEDKLNMVKRLKEQGFSPVIMVGDGVNDAPALAAADAGIAIGVLGTSASTEAGSIVITSENISRVADAVTVSRRVLFIAKQSIFVGMGLSFILMFAGAFGMFIPVVGALAQEVIDVIVIVNALRVKGLKLA